jgi:hypothetical protein
MTDAVLLSMLDRPCTIIGRSQTGPVDRYNQPTWVSTETETVWYVEQTEAREVTEGRTTGIATHLGVWPSETEIDDSDKVSSDGVTYEVLGPPWRVWEPGSGESHVEANLRVVE